LNEEYDYHLEGPSVERIDEFTETKIFVAKTLVTESEAKALFEKEKVEVFKGFFRRPKEEEIVVEEIVKSYEPYMIMGGRYELRYLTQRTYDIDLLDEAVSVFILGEELIVPEPEKDEDEAEVEIKGEKKKGFFDGLFGSFGKKKPVSKPEIQITGIEHVLIEKDITEAHNYQGNSINPDILPDAELIEANEQFLQTNKINVPHKYVDIENFTQQIIDEYAQKPENVQRTLFEKLTLTDRKIFYYPVFWAKMTYKGSKHKNVRLDGVTKKLDVPKGTRYAPPPTTDASDDEVETELEHKENADYTICPGCGEKVDDEITFCPECGVKVN